MKQGFERSCHYLNSLIDAQTVANSGCRHGEQLISDDDIVSTFRQQITASGISPSSTDTYDRILYDTLLRPFTTNRRDPTKYLETKNITELSGLCVHTLSSARAALWHPPNTETKEERDRNRRRPDTAPPNPQQGNYSYHLPVHSGNAQQGNFGAPVAQQGNFGAPAPPVPPNPGTAHQRFVHPSFPSRAPRVRRRAGRAVGLTNRRPGHAWPGSLSWRLSARLKYGEGAFKKKSGGFDLRAWLCRAGLWVLAFANAYVMIF